MKKMISVVMAAAALAGVGMAQAQTGSECVTQGKCDTVQPYQGGNAQGTYDPRLAEQRGLVAPGTADAWSGGYGGYGAYGLPYVLSDGRLAQRYGSAYPRTSRDRDGDGVRNNRDSRPDDPRYR